MRWAAAGVVVYLFAVSCAPLRTSVAPPQVPGGRMVVNEQVPATSRINIPIEMRAEVIERIINQHLPEVLFESDTMTLAGVKPVRVVVMRADTLTLSLERDELHYRVPLRIAMRFSFSVDVLGIRHTEYQDVEASIALSLRSRLFVKNDWRVVTMTHSPRYEWLSEPVVKARFLTVPVKPVVDRILVRYSETFGSMIDEAVAGLLDLKKVLHPLWMELQEPRVIMEHPQVWLRLTPRSVHMTQLEGRGGFIRGSVGVETVAETFIGTRPDGTRVDSLPPFLVPGSIDSSFALNLYSEIRYDHATALARGYLMGRSFSAGRREVIVQDVVVMGIGEYVAVQFDFTGSWRGRAYVIGDVYYDTIRETIRVENMAFDLSTQRRIQGRTARFLHDIIVSRIRPLLQFPLREQLLVSQLALQRMLCNNRIADNVYLTGYLDSLTVSSVTVTDQALRTLILARGSMSVRITD